jgi:hypothetical protein
MKKYYFEFKFLALTDLTNEKNDLTNEKILFHYIYADYQKYI